jgi:hypothetical protein
VLVGKPGDERGTTETMGSGIGGTLSSGGGSTLKPPTSEQAPSTGPASGPASGSTGSTGIMGGMAQAAKDLASKAKDTFDEVTPTVP